MTLIDNTKTFLKGVYGDVAVTVAAGTTLKQGTVLTVGADNKIVPYTSDAQGTLGYILAQDVTNPSADTALEIPSIRVFECGEVDKAKLVFTKNGDKLTDELAAKLKAAGIICCNVQEHTSTGIV